MNIKAGFNGPIPYISAEIDVDIDTDKKENQQAAWELYIELSTRITTQDLEGGEGDEKSALDSISNIFKETRKTLKENGKEALEVARLAILILNKIIRPFTTKWYCQNLEDSDNKSEFRNELKILKEWLINYKKNLSEIAGIDDFVD